MDAFIKDNVLPWLPPAAVVVGWWVANYQANSRERRKEVRALVDRLEKMIEEVCIKAVVYHTSDRADGALSQEIKILLKRIGLLIAIAHRWRGRDLELLETSVGALRDCVTLKNFDAKDFRKIKREDPFLNEIVRASDVIVSNLERAFLTQYG